MIVAVFSDYFAQKDNFLSMIDARVKMIFIVGLILIVVSSPIIAVPVIAAVVSISFLLSIKIPPKIILLRLTLPVMIAIMVVIMQIFYYGTTPIMEWDLFGVHFVGYKEGLLQGILIMTKVVGSVSLIIFLSMTTSLNKLFNAARWFKVPSVCIEIALLTFRYVFVLLEDAVTIRNAQKVRLGYSSFSRSLKSIGTLAGAVVIQAYDQSISTYEAMILRGYDGNNHVSCDSDFSKKDGIASLFFIFFIVLFLILIMGA